MTYKYMYNFVYSILMMMMMMMIVKHDNNHITCVVVFPWRRVWSLRLWSCVTWSWTLTLTMTLRRWRRLAVSAACKHVASLLYVRRCVSSRSSINSGRLFFCSVPVRSWCVDAVFQSARGSTRWNGAQSTDTGTFSPSDERPVSPQVAVSREYSAFYAGSCVTGGGRLTVPVKPSRGWHPNKINFFVAKFRKNTG